eukprot:gene7068-16285_t
MWGHDTIGPQVGYHSAQTAATKWWLPSLYYTKEIDTGLGFTLRGQR